MDIVEKFKRDTAKHEMTVALDDGLYRHLRFRHAGPNYSGYFWFDLITVPGTLIFQGDGESYVFSRTEDMFGFFRGSAYKGQPNFDYWAEKLTDGPRRATVYKDELLKAQVLEYVKDHYEGAETPSALMDEIRYKLLAELTGDQSIDALRVSEFRWWIDPYDEFRNKRPDFEFSDVFEWHIREHTTWFRWACHAILWGIGQYEAHRAKAVA